MTGLLDEIRFHIGGETKKEQRVNERNTAEQFDELRISVVARCYASVLHADRLTDLVLIPTCLFASDMSLC